MPSIYLNYQNDGGCTYHRVLCPARFCADRYEPLGWEFLVGEGLPDGHDVYVLHGLPTEYALAEIAKLRRKKKRFVWTVDDDWLTVPDWNPARPGETGLAVYSILKDMADWILTSTPALARTFDDVRHKVLCAPNLLDLSRFPPLPCKEDERGVRYYDLPWRLPVRVVWVGGHTHLGDTDAITDVLDAFLSKHGSNVAVVHYGAMPHPRLLRKYLHKNLYHQPIVPFASYQKILNSIDPHVYLCPLAPIEFNLSKSNLRVIEGWALGAAPVASDWGEYAAIRPGLDGRLAATPDAWASALDRLVTDHEHRINLGVTGRVRCEQEYDWNSAACRAPWYRVFDTIIGI